MSKRLDYKLGFFTKRKGVKGDIGIEVELEGGANLKLVPGMPKYWRAKPEQSLRNGMEYYLESPVSIKELNLALDEYELSMSASKPLKTLRCSTHIHVNVLDKTIREIYNILGFYFLVEDTLVRTQGHLRMGNLFCLRMSDAESMAPQIRSSIINGEYFRHFNMQSFKYGAINLAAPNKFGSLEFRFLRPITDKNDLKFWCTLLYDLVQNASKIPIDVHIKNVQNLSPKDFLKTVWSDEVITFLEQYESFDSMAEAFLGNLDYVASFEKAMRRVTREIIPLDYVENDAYEVPTWIQESEDSIATPNDGFEAAEPDFDEIPQTTGLVGHTHHFEPAQDLANVPQPVINPNPNIVWNGSTWVWLGQNVLGAGNANG